MQTAEWLRGVAEAGKADNINCTWRQWDIGWWLRGSTDGTKLPDFTVRRHPGSTRQLWSDYCRY